MCTITKCFNVSISSCLGGSVQCRRGLYFQHGSYISAWEHISMLILSSHVLPARINTIYKYCQDSLVRCISFYFGVRGYIS